MVPDRIGRWMEQSSRQRPSVDGVKSRSAGLAVMLATFLAVAILANVEGRRGVTGSAVPGPPIIGACLLDQTDETGGWGFGKPPYPALHVAPCSGPRWGEVVSVLPNALTSSTSVLTTDASGTQVTDNPVQHRCDDSKFVYLGVGAVSRPQFGSWFLRTGDIAAVGPSAVQRAAGQSWVACIVTPRNGHSATRYTGSVRNILVNGALPVAFATCSQLALGPAGILPARCDQAHRVEIFGYATTSLRDTQAQLNASCLELVRSLMRNSDPTKKGLLRIRAFTTHIDLSTGATTEGLGSNGDATCIVGSFDQHQLIGTLFGLGRNPIPWA